ncbi:MAG: hypothetical protein LBH01_09335 [Verrucomicrobiales bacterium]|jgi:hypothetical protein|nr:hypothetical protein [Verrucomicrobiales bacterium]
MIEDSPEINTWLNQFSNTQQTTALELLTRLQFISREEYSKWLQDILTKMANEPCGLYAVRKFDNPIVSLWDKDGNLCPRPSSSLGSEDFIQSEISRLMKIGNSLFKDHPSLKELRDNKIKKIVLIEDSISSGQRVSDYVRLMMNNSTMRSWWSSNIIKLHIVSYSRTSNSVDRIIKSLPGQNRKRRRHLNEEKIEFIGELLHHEDYISNKWGKYYRNIRDLCESIKYVRSEYRLGYGDMMSNIVFHHSVPDNLPGVLWYNESKRWKPLFDGRSFPNWLLALLENNKNGGRRPEMQAMLRLLKVINKGIRNKSTMSHILGLDVPVIDSLISRARSAGFVGANNRLTKVGKEKIWKLKENANSISYDRSLYIPKN